MKKVLIGTDTDEELTVGCPVETSALFLRNGYFWGRKKFPSVSTNKLVREDDNTIRYLT